MRRRLTIAIWLAGLLAVLLLVTHHGATNMAQAIAAAGWGLLAVTAFHVVPLTADTLAWHYLLPGSTRPAFSTLLWMRWIGESVNSLLPAAQIGGDLLRGRLAAQRGVPRAAAAGSVVADLTLSVLTLALSSLLGVLLALRHGERLFAPLLGGLLLALCGCAAALLLQRHGMFQRLTRLLGRFVDGAISERIAGNAAALDAALAEIYRRPRAVASSALWQVLAWLLGAGEIWLALASLGHPVSMLDAIMIECLIQAVRGAAFPVPGAAGVQEGGLILLGMLAGVPADTALAVSLIKRVRELVLGLPGLVAWQYAEGRRWLRPRD